ncbi:uncharacterized protein LOC128559602 [Mercenaria mercenaria]|uniref:uncharacterized protein LOC128559602 n=1 Tax=Mercenaria mercenaria TaxID=6596 RepID=UPI00234E8536|nr:uncharacterized protein LOC128559602 [Mercenaria mercenaria]
MPCGYVAKRASEITGVEILCNSGTRQMTKHGKAVNAVGLGESLELLITWIESIGDKPKVLIAHNGKNFDMQILLRNVRKCGLEDDFCKAVAGFSDSYILLRTERKDIKQYKLTSLYSEFVQETYCAHSAAEDALALLKVYRAARIDRKATLKYSIKVEDAFMYTNDVAENRNSVRNLQRQLIYDGKNVISNNIAKKICSSGLNYKALEVAFQRNNTDGLKLFIK